ncbi:MAG: hypothetical protein ACQESF_06995 [Nanobdellota archaeon]
MKTKDEKIKDLETEVERLKDKEKKLEHDIKIFRQIFDHLNKQFEKIKKEKK